MQLMPGSPPALPDLGLRHQSSFLAPRLRKNPAPGHLRPKSVQLSHEWRIQGRKYNLVYGSVYARAAALAHGLRVARMGCVSPDAPENVPRDLTQLLAETWLRVLIPPP